MTRPVAEAIAQVDHRWLRAARFVFMPAGVLCLLVIGNWRGAVLWVALSGLYTLVQPRIASVMERSQARRWTPATLGLLGTTVLSAGPIIAAGSASPMGTIVGLIMLAAGVQFLIAGYAAAPRLGLLVALPCVLAAAWIVTNLKAVPPEDLVIVALGTTAALLFTAVHTRTALKDRLTRARDHATLVAQISEAHDAAVHAEQISAGALERLRQSVGATPAGLAFFGADDSLSFWNDHLADYCRAYGVELTPGLAFEDLLARMEADESTPRAGRNNADRMNLQLAVHAAGESIELARFDGRWFRYEYRRLPDGGASTTIIDITDIKQRENFIQAIFNNNAVPMCVVDPETLKFHKVNDALVALFGWDRTELEGMTVHDLLTDSDREFFRLEHRKKLLDPDHSADRFWRCRTREGTELFIQPYVSQVIQSNGKVVLTGSLLDVTARTISERRKVVPSTRAALAS
ncbi:PAS domain S-box protein [uncultured Brevundimonas sp.]|uniref:PAS domain-containing protein n=1 Tax=uncultured Brevundimonas sp. TaxID=213418 RepID=UPI0030EE1DE5